jgi:single-strand DNA-binding protein
MPHGRSNTSVTIPLATVARAPDMRITPNGTAKTEILVAADRGYGRDSGTDWFSVITWSKTAEFCQRLVKGQKISIGGHLRGDFYQAKDGSTRRSTEIHADSVQVLTWPARREEDLPTRQLEAQPPRLVEGKR